MSKYGWMGCCAVLVLALAFTGCATTQSQAKMTPEEQVSAAVTKWKDGVLSKDVPTMMVSYSEHFTHPELGDKAGVQSYLDEAKAAGYLEGIEVDTTRAKIEVDGEKAVVYPIDINGSFGSIVYELSFTKEGDAWMITGTSASGV
ncbi:MAG: hypothetical protein HYV26_02455 [Candidatus Hydrogenedentes bacterium]|nr:hypothetical protein [Candidatus Hydrogenedentota bacterium]